MELEEHGNVAISQKNYGIESQEILCNKLFRFQGGLQVAMTSKVKINNARRCQKA
jgi:hypothetical protein